MDAIAAWFSGMDAVAMLACVSGAAALWALWMGLKVFVDGRDVVRARLSAAEPRVTTSNAGTAARRELPNGLVALTSLAGGGKGAESRHLRRQLIRAGFRGELALQVLLLAKIGLAVVLPLAYLLVGMRREGGFDYALPTAVALCAAGFYAPNYWLHARMRQRQLEIEKGLPEVMDLLVTCVEAGLGLDAALSRVAAETALSVPVLALELNLTSLEIQAGIPRVEGFRRLSERTGVEDLKSLAATLAQADMFGTSVATALRVRAEWMRTRRMQRAEERAAMVAVKMTLPLVTCILPSLIAIVMGPAVIGIAKNLLPGLG